VAAGYFADGTISIELGAHAFATPVACRRNTILSPAATPAVVLDAGGGTLELQVTGQRVRDNLGDAERYIYEHLHALGTSDPGTLGCEDNAGRRATFGDSVCVAAEGEVRAFRFCDMRMTFLSPERASQPAWGTVPSAPATYAATSTAQDYAAGGITLGRGASLRIEMAREFPLRQIPRARGARARGPRTGALLRFVVTAYLLEPAANLAAALAELSLQIGPRPVDLTGNGNTYEDVVLDSLRPAHTDLNHTRFEAEFVKEI